MTDILTITHRSGRSPILTIIRLTDAMCETVKATAHNVKRLKETIFPALDYIQLDGWAGSPTTFHLDLTHFLTSHGARLNSDPETTWLVEWANEHLQASLAKADPEVLALSLYVEVPDGVLPVNAHLSDMQKWSGMDVMIVDTMYALEHLSLVFIFQQEAEISASLPYGLFGG